MNRLIALSGQNIPGVPQSYMAGAQDMQRQRANELAIQSKMLENESYPQAQRMMNMQRAQEIASSQQKMQMGRMEEYLKSVAPIASDIVNDPDPRRRQAKWKQALPYVSKQAQQLGLPAPTEELTQDDLVQFQAISQRYGPDQFQTRMQDGDPFQVNLKTGKASAHPLGKKAPLVENRLGSGVPAWMEKGQEKRIEGIVKGMGDREKMRTNLMKQNALFDRAALAISRGVKTGFGQKATLPVQRLAKSLGIEVENLSEKEMIVKTGNELAMLMRNPESGGGLTGQTSNRDLQFLLGSVFGLEKTVEGNLEIIKMGKKYNQVFLDMVKEQNRIVKELGYVPLDLEDQLVDYLNNYGDIFTKEERENINRIIEEGQSQPTPVTGYEFEDQEKESRYQEWLKSQN